MQTLAMPTVARIDSPSAPAPEPLPAPVRPTHRGATPVGRQSSRRRQERSTTMRIPQPQCAVQRKFVDDESSSVLDAAQSCLPSRCKDFCRKYCSRFYDTSRTNITRAIPLSLFLFRCRPLTSQQHPQADDHGHHAEPDAEQSRGLRRVRGSLGFQQHVLRDHQRQHRIEKVTNLTDESMGLCVLCAVLHFRHHRHVPSRTERLDHDRPHRDRVLRLRRTAPQHRTAYANAIAIGSSAAASGITASPVARSTHSWRRGKQVAPPSTRIRRASTESRGRRNAGRGR